MNAAMEESMAHGASIDSEGNGLPERRDSLPTRRWGAWGVRRSIPQLDVRNHA
jgi:hypothetical protein